MIVKKNQQLKITQKQEIFYNNLINRHNRYIQSTREKNYHLKGQTFPVSQSQTQKLENKFYNTLFKAGQPNQTLELYEMQQIEPNQFVQLCQKLDQMVITYKRSVQIKWFSIIKKLPNRLNKSQPKIKVMQPKIKSLQSLQTLQKNVNKIISTISKTSQISSRQFMKLFRQKLKQVQKICQIKQAQQDLQIKNRKDRNNGKFINQLYINNEFILTYKNLILSSIKQETMVIQSLKQKIIQLQLKIKSCKNKSEQVSMQKVKKIEEIIIYFDQHYKLIKYYFVENTEVNHFGAFKEMIKYFIVVTQDLYRRSNLSLANNEPSIQPSQLSQQLKSNLEQALIQLRLNDVLFLRVVRQINQSFLRVYCNLQPFYKSILYALRQDKSQSSQSDYRNGRSSDKQRDNLQI